MTKNWDHAAGVVWPLLTKAAKKRLTLTYGEIAPHIPTNPLNVGRSLGPIQSFCLENRLPPLTAIVVGGGTDRPGTGFIAWDVDDLPTAHEIVFNFDWAATPNPYGAFGISDSEKSLANQIVRNPELAADIYSRVRIRGIAQRIFRRVLLEVYGQCAFCGLTFEDALVGCHIVSWSEALPEQRLDPRNGVLLCSSHHSLFDAALMTVSRSLKIVYCDPKAEDGSYSEQDKALTVKLHGKSIRIPTDQKFAPSARFLAIRHNSQKWGDLP